MQGVFIGDYTAVAIGTDCECCTRAGPTSAATPGTTTPNQDAYTQAFRID